MRGSFNFKLVLPLQVILNVSDRLFFVFAHVYVNGAMGLLCNV